MSKLIGGKIRNYYTAKERHESYMEVHFVCIKNQQNYRYKKFKVYTSSKYSGQLKSDALKSDAFSKISRDICIYTYSCVPKSDAFLKL